MGYQWTNWFIRFKILIFQKLYGLFDKLHMFAFNLIELYIFICSIWLCFLHLLTFSKIHFAWKEFLAKSVDRCHVICISSGNQCIKILIFTTTTKTMKILFKIIVWIWQEFQKKSQNFHLKLTVIRREKMWKIFRFDYIHTIAVCSHMLSFFMSFFIQ